MENTEKKLYHVKFMPDGQVGVIPSGSTLMDAAQNTGVYITSICGGKAQCGKCRVVVREGRVNMKPNSFIDKKEIKKGYVIACLTEVLQLILHGHDRLSMSQERVTGDSGCDDALYDPSAGIASRIARGVYRGSKSFLTLVMAESTLSTSPRK